jgi:molybdopterin-guanine dinucleotide biosynthesis protein A
MNDVTRRSTTGVAGIILAGGRNSRMGGRDKAFLQVDGETALARILRVLRGCFDEVLVVSNRPEKYRSFAVDVTADELPDLGPLGGLHAGLGRIRAQHAFVTACDMPFLRREPILFLVDQLRAGGGPVSEAVVPCWDGDIEPLHAIYAAHLRSRIAAAINDGARSMRDFLPLANATYVPQGVMEGVGGAEESFRNVNTPEEAARFSVQLVG